MIRNSGEILLADFQKSMSPEEASRALYYIGQGAQKGTLKIVQIGLTVFLIHPKSQTAGEVHIVTEDGTADIPKRFKAGINTARQLGFHTLSTYFDSPAYFRFLDLAGVQYKKIPIEPHIAKYAVEMSF
jgi:hypothetical protein